MTELRPLEDPRRATGPNAPQQPPADLTARWAQQLRAKASGGKGSNRSGGGGGRYRPSSSSTTTSNRTPSLLSLETPQHGGPTSPATTSHSSAYPSAPHQLPSHRHSAGPSSSHHHHQQQHHSGNRSHSSLPVPPSSSGHPSHHQGHHGGRHRDQLERVYQEQRYDAEFDRGIGTSRSGAVSSSATPQASTSRLFNPDAPASNGVERRRERELRGEETGSARHKARSKREPVEVGDLGRRQGGGREQESKESLESEESGHSGRPGSRTSKDGRQRRSRREGEGKGSRRDRGDEDAAGGPGGSSTSLPSQVSASRQLFDPRRDDPVRFAQPNGVLSKRSTADSRSFVSFGSAASVSEVSTNLEDGGGSGLSSRGGGDQQAKREAENPVVAQLRRAYRDITDLESKLQDENRAAMAAATRDDEAGQGLRIAGGGKRFDDEYWVRLATTHKQ